MVHELAVGRRIAFYKMNGELGCGNFSRVKLGIHALTKGKNQPSKCHVTAHCIFFLNMGKIP